MKTKNIEKQLNQGFDEAKKRVPPSEYNNFLQKINLKDIYVTEIKSKLHQPSFPGEASLSFKENAKILEIVEGLIEIEVEYKLSAKSSRKKVFSIDIKYNVVFEFEEEIPSEFFVLYNKFSLPLQTFPYFREYVNTILSRMGLPSLILPLRKNLIGDK